MKGLHMKKSVRMGRRALALAIGALSQAEAEAAYTNSNGRITKRTLIITARTGGDGHFFAELIHP